VTQYFLSFQRDFSSLWGKGGAVNKQSSKGMKSNVLYVSLNKEAANPVSTRPHKVKQLLPSSFSKIPQKPKKNKQRISCSPQPLPPAQYRSYIRSRRWKARRKHYFATHVKRCAACPSKIDIQLHHVTYERLGCERDEDLILLCCDCHTDFHALGKTRKNMRSDTELFVEMRHYDRRAAAILSCF
jgi:hypothetical protein